MYKVILVDDHEMVRQGVRSYYEFYGNFEVDQEFSDGVEALVYLNDHKVDLVVSDLTMPNMSGIEFGKKIQELGIDTKLMFMSMHSEDSLIAECIQLESCQGYLLKDDGLVILEEASNNILEGRCYMSINSLTNYLDSVFKKDNKYFEMLLAYSKGDVEPMSSHLKKELSEVDFLEQAFLWIREKKI